MGVLLPPVGKATSVAASGSASSRPLGKWLGELQGLRRRRRSLVVPVMAAPPTIVSGNYQGASAVASVAAGGSGYAVNDLITHTGGTFLVPAISRVTSVSGGAVTGATIVRGGVYSANPSNPVAQGSTTGSGTGCTLNLTMNQRGTSDISNRRAAGVANAQWNVVEPRTSTLGGDYTGSSAYSATGAWVEFETDSRYINTHLYPGNGGYQVFVDGERIAASQIATPASTSPFLSLAFANNNVRHIRIVGIALGITNFYIENERKIWAPILPKPVDCYILGDSYSQLTGASAGPGTDWCSVLAETTGWRVTGAGIGSTGYNTADGASAVLTRVQNDLGKRSIAPEIIIFALSFNDAAGNQTTLGQKALAAFQAARALYPEAIIFVLGPWTPLGSTTNLTTTAATVLAAVQATGDARCIFIPIADLVDSVNKAVYTDVDNTHPSQAGHAFLGAVIGQKLLAAIG